MASDNLACGNCGKLLSEHAQRCTGCRQAFYCDSNCQAKAWATHQNLCRATARITALKAIEERRAALGCPKAVNSRFKSLEGVPISSPYDNGVLAEDLQSVVLRIRTIIREWLISFEKWDILEPSTSELIKVTEALLDIQLSIPAPKPQKSAPFKRQLIGLTRTYWQALITSLTDEQRQDLAQRLDQLDPFDHVNPQFNGSKCVETPAELNAEELEGLMRVGTAVINGISTDEVVSSWWELAEVACHLWE